MKKIIAMTVLSLGVIGLAQARDIGPDEAHRLLQAGTVKSLEDLNKAALEKHPGAQITDTELDEEYGRYVYQVELRDTQGVEWDLDFDAATGELLRHQQDD